MSGKKREMVFLAPALSKVLEAAECLRDGRETPEPLSQLVPAAVAFVEEGIRLFRLLAPGILRTPEVEELFRQIHLEQQAQVEALQMLANVPSRHNLNRHITSLRSASERLLQLFPKLQEEEAKEKVYSPFPVIDHCIRVGINLLDGKVDLNDFQTRLPAVAALVSGLRQDVDRFRLLYGRDDLVKEAMPHLERLEAGLGAGYTYAGNRDKVALQDSLRLLGASGVKLMEVLQQFDVVAQQEVRYHSLRFLEELGRAGDLGQPPWLIQRVWSGVEQALDYYRRELDLVRRNPVYFEVENLCRQMEEPLEKASQALAGVDRNAIPLGTLSRFAGPMDQLDAAFQKLQAEFRATSTRYQEAPNIHDLRELLGRTLNGEISVALFLAQLAQVQEAHQGMLAGLERGASDPLVEELAQLTRSHSMAFARMKLYADDLDREHLRQGWRLVAVTLPRILDLSKQLRERLGVKPVAAAAPVVVCFRCGTDNPRGQKFCRKCSALLPQAAQEVTDYTDITNPPEPQGPAAGTPANVARLEELLRQAELGQMGRAAFKAEMDEQLRGADRVRQGFEKQVVAMMGKSPAFDAYAQFFAMQMAHYVQGLFEMQSFGEGAPSSVLREGFARCLSASQELQGFQGRIQEAMRGGQR